MPAVSSSVKYWMLQKTEKESELGNLREDFVELACVLATETQLRNAHSFPVTVRNILILSVADATLCMCFV